MKAIIYARFSPRKNASECLSIEHQIHRCRAYCEARGYEVDSTLSDREMSGKRADNRPGLQDAIAHACRAKGVLVAYKLDRLARNTKDAITLAETLNRAGAHLASITEQIDSNSPTGRLFFTILAAFAQFEREVISERTSNAMRQHQAGGRLMGSRCPYGWRKSPERGKMEPERNELLAIHEIKRLRGVGYGLREIARSLDNRGSRCRGKPWRHQTIKAILEREDGN